MLDVWGFINGGNRKRSVSPSLRPEAKEGKTAGVCGYRLQAIESKKLFLVFTVTIVM